jgi:hypothetical protein
LNSRPPSSHTTSVAATASGWPSRITPRSSSDMPLETGTSPERGSKNFLVHLRCISVLRCHRSTRSRLARALFTVSQARGAVEKGSAVAAKPGGTRCTARGGRRDL